MKTPDKLILLALLVGLGILLAISSYHSTESTEVGVRTRKIGLLSKAGVEDRIYPPGSVYLFLPLINEWDVYDTRIQVVEMKRDNQGRNKELAFKTIEGNDLSLDIRFAYRIDPDKAAFIRQFVAHTIPELTEKIFKPIARSRTRDFFNELNTQEFYRAEARNKATEQAKAGLQEIFKNYGIILESVSLMDYRFNDAYTKIIEQKKIAEQNKSQIEARIMAQFEANIKMRNEADGIVNGMIAQVNGLYTNTVAAAEAYYDQQKIIAEATLVEGKNQAETIRKQREAMATAGGETKVKMKMAENLKGKRIIMVPMNPSSMNINTLDFNKFMEIQGLRGLAAERRLSP